jgi:6-phosphogluconolactonase
MSLPAWKVCIFDSESDLIDSALRLWTRAFEESLRARGGFCAALSGGKTPIPFYRELARQKRTDFREKPHLFLVDERFGPPGHPESNGRMIAEVLTRPMGLPPEHWHPMPLDVGSAEESASWYEAGLSDFFRLNRGEFPAFDFILLGIGADGHTASLFPGSPALEENQETAAAVNLKAPRGSRVTLTLPVLNRGRRVVFLVRGEEKAGIVRRVIWEKDPNLPAVRVRPAVFLLDREAGRELPSAINEGLPPE